MEKNISVTNLMVESHNHIERLFDKFKASIEGDFKLTIRLFDEFKWEFEKHIFIEEKAIFKFFNLSKNDDYFDVVPNLIKEHDIILETLNEIENNLVIKGSDDTHRFKELLAKHKNFEEETIYPKLDKELNDSQKNSIFIKINDSFRNLS